jgi:hypothetical protein
MLRNYEDKMVRNYDDKTFVIIASGPSLTSEDVEYCRGKAKVIAINDNYLMAPWADYLYFCDGKWWRWHQDKEEFKNFQGQIYTRHSEAGEQENINHIQSKPEKGLSKDKDVIHEGSNSGYQAINLAYHLGAKRIILLGYDMQTTNGENHWFGLHPDKIVSNYNNFVDKYNQMAPHAKEIGLEIINCTRQTALKCFPRQELRKALT